MHKMLRSVSIVLLAAWFIFWAVPGVAAQFKLKFGTLAPDNTPWSKILQDLKRNLEEGSKGELKIIVYLNGSRGDEREMLEKMRLGQLTGGGFSTGGVCTKVPELQIFELPFLFENNEEVDFIMDKVLREDMARLLEQKGLYLYCWAENGWIDFANSTRPVKTPEDVAGLKVFGQETDLSLATMKAIGGQVVPMAVPQVLTSLQTGLLDAYATTPIFATGSQWASKVKYWTDLDLFYQPALVVFDLKFWNSLPPHLQKLFLDLRGELQTAARRDVRGIDEGLFEAFRKNGIEIYKPSPQEREQFRQKATLVHQVLVQKGIIPQEMLDKVYQALDVFRASKQHGKR